MKPSDFGDWREYGPAGGPVPAHVPAFPFSSPAGHGHVVRFYANDMECIEALAAFLSPGLDSGEAALVFLSPEHRQALSPALAEIGIDPKAAVVGGRLFIHDAREILDGVLSPEGYPDEDLFMRVIGGLIAKASAGKPALRAFAGMGALPWAQENPDAALALEQLWNKLGRTVAFSLLCAYPIGCFRGRNHRLSEICDAHDSLIPCGPLRLGATEPESHRELVELQLKLAELQEAPAERGRAAGQPDRAIGGLADAIPALLWATNPEGRCAYVNRTWLEFTGNDEQHELNRGMEGIHPEDRGMVEAAYARALEARAGFRAEFRFLRRDGAWRWLLGMVSPRLDPDGSFLGFVGAGVDITERKAAEEQSRQMRNLESVGRLAGGLAHDFNNLLTAINGYSEIGLSIAPEGGPLRDFLSEIKRAGDRASELTRQLLAYGRRQVMAAAVFDLSTTLDDMDRMLRRLLGNDIRLERTQAAGLGRVRADPGLVQQLIVNLALNAREAMSAGGVLTLETLDGIAASGPDQIPRPYVMLTLRDDGPGMTEEVRARIFEPFFTTKEESAIAGPEYAGTGPQSAGNGLGLSTAYGIVSQSGGFISVESEPGQGSVFRAHFPWIDPEEGKPAALSPDPDARMALVVSADDSLRRFLARVLAGEGFAVVEAADPASAQACAESLPHLELLITEDPCAQVRASALLARLKIRHSSLRALAIPASPEAFHLPGGDGADGILHLQLPINRTGLLDRIRRAIATSA